VPPKAFNSDSGIDCETGVSRIDVAESLGKSLITGSEVYEADFAGRKEVRIPRAEVELGTKKAVQRTGPGGCESCGRTIVEEVCLVGSKS
jgi:hypothetical protein